MRHPSKAFVACSIGALVGALGLVSCGGSNSTSTATATPTQPSVAPLTQAQITSLENAITSTENVITPKVLTQAASDGSNANAKTIPLNVSQFCTDTGTVSITGTVTESDGPGRGAASLKGNLVIGFSKCVSGGITLDGSLSNVGQINFVGTDTDFVTVVNPVTFTISGTHTFVLNGVTGTISFNCPSSLTIDVDAGTAGSIAATGNATLQYPTGQNTTTVPCSAFATGFNGVFSGLGHQSRRLQSGRSK